MYDVIAHYTLIYGKDEFMEESARDEVVSALRDEEGIPTRIVTEGESWSPGEHIDIDEGDVAVTAYTRAKYEDSTPHSVAEEDVLNLLNSREIRPSVEVIRDSG